MVFVEDVLVAAVLSDTGTGSLGTGLDLFCRFFNEIFVFQPIKLKSEDVQSGFFKSFRC